MTDNFQIFRTYMMELGIPLDKLHINDNVFEIQLLRRGKDHKDMSAANYSFKNYYVDSIEGFDRVTEEIKQCCEIFGLRVYISVNVKSKTKLQLQCLKIISDNLCMGELKKPWKTFYKAFGATTSDNQRWIVDVDWQDEVNNNEYINQVKHIIESCQSGYDKIVICEVPTKSGIHLITHPFNMKEYREAMEKYAGDDIDIPEVKKNHITLLFEDL